MDKNVAKGWVEGNAATYQQETKGKYYGEEVVDLNEIVKSSLTFLEEKIQSTKAIVRYDTLPCISGNKKKVQVLFSNIFSSIIEHPPLCTKLLIYLRSHSNTSEVMDLTLTEGYHNYTICVYTNILSNDTWQTQNKQLLTDCAAIVKELKGSFTHNHIENIGCLYDLQLPGKSIE